jgi:hypothetical protein
MAVLRPELFEQGGWRGNGEMRCMGPFAMSAVVVTEKLAFECTLEPFCHATADARTTMSLRTG